MMDMATTISSMALAVIPATQVAAPPLQAEFAQVSQMLDPELAALIMDASRVGPLVDSRLAQEVEVRVQALQRRVDQTEAHLRAFEGDEPVTGSIPDADIEVALPIKRTVKWSFAAKLHVVPPRTDVVGLDGDDWAAIEVLGQGDVG